jgi:two-component system chemotaxis response regulator CheB
MPHMTGMEALDIIMREMPLPVIVVSSMNREIIEETLEALEHGAFDFVVKPTELASDKLFQIENELIDKVLTVAALKGKTRPHLETVPPAVPPKPLPPLPVLPHHFATTQIDCVAIGVSTGGPTALYQIIPKLPEDFPAGIVIVQHMPPGFTKPLAERMDKNSNITVKEAQTGDEITPGTALVAPGGAHLFLERNKSHKIVARIDPEPSDLIHVPCIDLTFSDVAEFYRNRCVGVILTGMGKDGVDGLQKIKDYGGSSIAEDESTCVVFGMPEVAIQRGIVDHIAPVYDIAEIIMSMI